MAGPRWGCIKGGGGEGLVQSWGGSSPLQGITQPLPKHWFWHTQIQNFPVFPWGWVSPEPVLGKGRAGPAQSYQHCSPRVGTDAISGLRGA